MNVFQNIWVVVYHHFTDTFIMVHCPFSQICTSTSCRRTSHAHGLSSPFHPRKISYSETSNYVAYGRCSFGPGVLTSFPALLYCKTKDSQLPGASIFCPFAPHPSNLCSFLFCLHVHMLPSLLSSSCHCSDTSLILCLPSSAM